jgi:ribosomal protein S26
MSSGITRRKGKSGRAKVVECAICSAKVPRDKAVEKQRHFFPLDRMLRQPLKEREAKIYAGSSIAYYCISCAKHRKYV